MRSQVLINQGTVHEPTMVEGLAVPSPKHNALILPHANHVGIFQQMIDGLSEQAALIDASNWTVLAVNDSWERASAINGFTRLGPGNDYFREVGKLAARGHNPARTALTGMAEIRDRKRASFRMVFDGVDAQAGKKFETRFAMITVGGREYVRVTRYDITELTLLRRMRARFGGKVMKVQEEERRRMGRELHDSGLQLLAGLGLSVARLKQARSERVTAEVIADMEALLLEAQKEFRSVSFLAHPPQLERFGLIDALQSLVEGFGKRAGLKASFTVEGDCEITSPDAEHTIFRMVQEGLSNVHRHARASQLTVQLIGRRRMVHVVVADDGRGIPAELQPGVGLLGMKERLRELGGRLTIHRGSPGTVLAASLPLTAILHDPASTT
jgi:two-component system NarL family sensor kinase